MNTEQPKQIEDAKITMPEINQLLRELYQEGKLDPKPNVWTRAAEAVQLHCGDRGPAIPIDREFLIAMLATFAREELAAARSDGIKLACEMVDEMYGNYNRHPFMQGDCVLAKLNLLPNDQIRPNPKPDGWVAINGPEDLPKESGEYEWDTRVPIRKYFDAECGPTLRLRWLENFSHWRKIEPPQPSSGEKV